MRTRPFLQTSFVILTLLAATAHADEIEYVVRGIDEPALTNVRHHVSAYRIGRGAHINNRLRRKIIEEARLSAARAMRPYGYFHPQVVVDMQLKEAHKWVLAVDVSAGPPVLVKELRLEVSGPGSEYGPVRQWRANFPLAVGKVLDQNAWDNAKLEALELLAKRGYLRAGFSAHEIRVDPTANSAALALVLDTGPRAVMGKVTFNQAIVRDGVLTSLQRFRPGDAYDTWLVERFRMDLWRSGYFENVEVVERQAPSAEPPRVDLEVNLAARKVNTYQGTLGYGTDTLARFQFLWRRHLLSRRGDNFDVGFGWQQRDDNFSLQANYRLPRETDTQQFWITSFGANSEQQALSVSRSAGLANRFDIARGRVNDYSLKLGKTRVREMRGGHQQLFETPYVQQLSENRDFQLTDARYMPPPDATGAGPLDALLHKTSHTLVIGVEWDWPEISGTGFHTVGHHEQAWLFTSHSTWGSDLDFSQVYLSTRWNRLLGERWKLLLRAEAGYSDAPVIEVQLPVDGNELAVEATRLPHLYRFKAGGSRSVRGYAFENLDNNGLGSNNLLTASAETEFHFHTDWSVAAFFDVGNAFNDWGKPGLKRGAGLGLRWYSMIGAVRLDVARGFDLQGDPWQLHLTLGTPLL